MPGNPPSRRLTTRQRLLHATCGLLAATFALPSCMTTALWERPRDAELQQWSAPDFVVHRERAKPRAPFALWAIAPPALRSQLANASTGQDAWLRITALDAEEGASMQLLVQLLQDPRSSALSRGRQLRPLELDWTAGDSNTARAHLWFDSNDDRYLALRELPGSHRTNYVLPWYTFEAECRVEWLERPAAELLGPPLRGIVFNQVEPVPYRSSLVSRIVLTPVAVLGDVVLSPFQLLMWLTN